MHHATSERQNRVWSKLKHWGVKTHATNTLSHTQARTQQCIWKSILVTHNKCKVFPKSLQTQPSPRFEDRYRWGKNAEVYMYHTDRHRHRHRCRLTIMRNLIMLVGNLINSKANAAIAPPYAQLAPPLFNFRAGWCASSVRGFGEAVDLGHG